MSTEEATKAYEMGDFALARMLLEELARDGDVQSQYLLATILHLGLAGEPEGPEAVRLYKQACEQQNYASVAARAANNLATLYVTGMLDVPVDRSAAHEYFQLANRLGFYRGYDDHDPEVQN